MTLGEKKEEQEDRKEDMEIGGHEDRRKRGGKREGNEERNEDMKIERHEDKATW